MQYKFFLLLFTATLLLSSLLIHRPQLNDRAAAQARIGVDDTGQVRIPANYNAWTPPALGATYTDEAFGANIRRISNGQTQFNAGAHHELATVSPFNRNNTRVLLLDEERGFYVADLNGNVVISAAELGLRFLVEPRWSVSDANVFYFHEGNQLCKYDLTTKQKTVVRAFTQYEEINFGLTNSDLSDDGDHLLIIGKSGARTLIGVYQLSTNTLGATLDPTNLGRVAFINLTPNNNVVIRWLATGAGRYKGFELFDKNMNFQRQLITFGATYDTGRETNGDEVMLITADADPQPAAGCENNGIEKVKLATGQKTCLLPLAFRMSISISINNGGGHQYALITTSDLAGTTEPPSKLPSDWQSKWKARYNELLLVKLDGSEKLRVAHHRSRMIGEYWWQPRGAISRDGRYAVFDSNFGTQPAPEYTDVFLVLINPAPVTNTTAAHVSAASYRNDALLAAETITAAFGNNLADGTQTARTLPLPLALAGTSVKVRDSSGTERFAPLFFAAPGQVNYLMPQGLALGAATITITNSTGATATGNVQIEKIAPGLFAADASGRGWATGYVLRVRSGAQTTEPIARYDRASGKFTAVPIELGEATDQVFLILFGTGLRGRNALMNVTAKIGGVDAQVAYAGAQGGLAGLDQVNLQLPRSLAGRGEVEVAVALDGKAANAVKVQIR